MPRSGRSRTSPNPFVRESISSAAPALALALATGDGRPLPQRAAANGMVWYGSSGRAHQRVRDGQERRKVEAGQRYCRRHRRFCTAAHPPAKQRCVWFPRRVGRAKPVGRALLRDPQSVRFGRSPQCAPETMCGVMTRRQPKTMFELTITRLAPTCDQSSSRPNTGHSHECSHG